MAARTWGDAASDGRNRWRQVDTPAGAIPALLPPGRISSFDYRMDAIPAVGQHTHAILQEVGHHSDSIAAMQKLGAI